MSSPSQPSFFHLLSIISSTLLQYFVVKVMFLVLAKVSNKSGCKGGRAPSKTPQGGGHFSFSLSNKTVLQDCT